MKRIFVLTVPLPRGTTKTPGVKEPRVEKGVLCSQERRVAEAREAQLAATEARERAAAAVLVQGYVAELLPAVLAGLRDQGYLMERIERGACHYLLHIIYWNARFN